MKKYKNFRFFYRTLPLFFLLIQANSIFANQVYVANSGDNTVSIIDSQGVAITPDGLFAYTTNYKSNSVSIIDTSTLLEPFINEKALCLIYKQI